jgi:hypothetical protein
MDEARPGQPRRITDANVEEVITKTLESAPTMWKLSKDPLFVDKVRDVVGLYLNPPERQTHDDKRHGDSGQ